MIHFIYQICNDKSKFIEILIRTFNFIILVVLLYSTLYNSYYYQEIFQIFPFQWNEIELKNNQNPKYLGVTLDRSLMYKKHCEKTKLKMNKRNGLLRKLTGSAWGTDCWSTYCKNISTIAMLLCRWICECSMGLCRSYKKIKHSFEWNMPYYHRLLKEHSNRKIIHTFWHISASY